MVIGQSTGSVATGTLSTDGGGALVIGGAGNPAPASLNFTKTIQIDRSIYTSTNPNGNQDFAAYPYAFASGNGGTGQHTVTMSGNVIINTPEARFGAFTSTLNMGSDITNFTFGPNGANPLFGFAGDNAGTINLTGNNTFLATNGVRLSGGELNITSDANIGGPNSPIFMTRR